MFRDNRFYFAAFADLLQISVEIGQFLSIACRFFREHQILTLHPQRRFVPFEFVGIMRIIGSDQILPHDLVDAHPIGFRGRCQNWYWVLKTSPMRSGKAKTIFDSDPDVMSSFAFIVDNATALSVSVSVSVSVSGAGNRPSMAKARLLHHSALSKSLKAEWQQNSLLTDFKKIGRSIRIHQPEKKSRLNLALIKRSIKTLLKPQMN